VHDDLPQGVEAPAAWRATEVRLRERMEGYTLRRPLRRGDVLSIPLLMPHALQHGVRTIEIQTPVYERMILSFAQKVLTQDHWDTAAAVTKMRLRAPVENPPEYLRRGEGIEVERIAHCREFEVRRVRLAAGRVLPLALDHHYALLIVIAGAVDLGGRSYAAEQAVLLPRGWRGEVAPAGDSRQPVFLLALPGA
jgi:mannose-6-phosphate isomerase class I